MRARHRSGNAGAHVLLACLVRHSFASLLLHEGRSVIYVARQLGHGAGLTMSTYGHVIDELEDAPTLDDWPLLLLHLALVSAPWPVSAQVVAEGGRARRGSGAAVGIHEYVVDAVCAGGICGEQELHIASGHRDGEDDRRGRCLCRSSGDLACARDASDEEAHRGHRRVDAHVRAFRGSAAGDLDGMRAGCAQQMKNQHTSIDRTVRPGRPSPRPAGSLDSWSRRLNLATLQALCRVARRRRPTRRGQDRRSRPRQSRHRRSTRRHARSGSGLRSRSRDARRRVRLVGRAIGIIHVNDLSGTLRLERASILRTDSWTASV